MENKCPSVDGLFFLSFCFVGRNQANDHKCNRAGNAGEESTKRRQRNTKPAENHYGDAGNRSSNCSLMKSFIMLFDIGFNKAANIFPSLAQRRDRDRKLAKVIIDVLAKRSVLYALFRISAERCDDLDIKAVRGRPVGRIKRASLQNAQKFIVPSRKW